MSFIMQTRVALSFLLFQSFFAQFLVDVFTLLLKSPKTQRTSLKLTIFHLKTKKKRKNGIILFLSPFQQRNNGHIIISFAVIVDTIFTVPNAISDKYNFWFKIFDTQIYTHINYSSFSDLDCFYEGFGYWIPTYILKYIILCEY